MSKKGELKRAIADSEHEIEALEKKRARSQSALFESVLMNRKPDPADSEYFRVFTQLIEKERENLRSLIAQLNELTKKK